MPRTLTAGMEIVTSSDIKRGIHASNSISRVHNMIAYQIVFSGLGLNFQFHINLCQIELPTGQVGNKLIGRD